MKKIYLLFLMAMILGLPRLMAQNPDCIYIATVTMTSKVIDDNTDNPKLNKKQEGVYVGTVTNWQKNNFQQIIKFYSVADQVMTVYGQSGKTSTVQYNLNSGAVEFDLGTQNVNYETFTQGTDQYTGYKNSGTCGFMLASANTEAVANVQVTIDLNNSKISFDYASEEADEPAELESVSPVSGSTVTPADDGSVSFTMTFSGKVVSMEVIVDGEDIPAENMTYNTEGNEWTIKVPAEMVSSSIKEENGLLKIKISKVTDENGLQVKFEDNPTLELNYTVKGQSTTATLNFAGTTDVLAVYQSVAIEEEDIQFLTPADKVEIDGSSYEFSYGSLIRFLFVVPEGYSLEVTSGVDQNASNWTLGTAKLEEKIVDEDDESGKLEYQTVATGQMLTVYPGAKDGTFTITVTKNAPTSLFISGDFNNNDPNGEEEWQLTPDGNIYTGTFDIDAANNLSFNFIYGSSNLVPATQENDEFVVSQNDVTLNFVDGIATSYFVNTTGETNWVIENWAGGELSVTVDFDANSVKFEYEVVPEVEEMLFIYGNFNNYEPNSEWKLFQGDPDDGEENIYTGYFDINAGDIEFCFQYGENFIVPATEDGTVTFTDNVFEGELVVKDLHAPYWTIENFEGGELAVRVDLDNNTVLFRFESQSTEEIWYLNGEVNEFYGFGDPDWALNPVEGEEGVFSASFEIPEGQFEFNLINSNGMVFIPAENYDPVEKMEVTFTEGTFTGNMIDAYFEEEYEYYWTNSEWEGGSITITVDASAGTITIIEDGYSAVNNISTNLNDSDVIYNLQGIRLNKVEKGLFIINGKKVMVK